jgi:hypothetical protein
LGGGGGVLWRAGAARARPLLASGGTKASPLLAGACARPPTAAELRPLHPWPAQAEPSLSLYTAGWIPSPSLPTAATRVGAGRSGGASSLAARGAGLLADTHEVVGTSARGGPVTPLRKPSIAPNMK